MNFKYLQRILLKYVTKLMKPRGGIHEIVGYYSPLANSTCQQLKSRSIQNLTINFLLLRSEIFILSMSYKRNYQMRFDDIKDIFYVLAIGIVSNRKCHKNEQNWAWWRVSKAKKTIYIYIFNITSYKNVSLYWEIEWNKSYKLRSSLNELLRDLNLDSNRIHSLIIIWIDFHSIWKFVVSHNKYQCN